MMRRKNWRASALLAGAAAFISGHLAFADTPATWSVDAVGSWTDGSLWSTSPNFPNNFGTTTYDAVINSSGAVVELNAPITVSGLGMLAGTLTGGGELTVLGDGSWLGGTIAGNGTIDIGGSLRIDGSDHTFSNFTVNIGSLATTTWNSHRIIALTGVEGGVVNNAGTFDDQTDDDWFWDNVQTPVFNNSGLYLKSQGSDGFAKSFWAVMNNSGQVHVQASGLWLAGGGTSCGSFNVDSGALLQISDFNQNFAGAGASTTVFSSSATLSSLGSVVFSHSFGSSVTEFNGIYDSAATVIDAHDPADNTDEGRVTFTTSALVNSNFIGSLQVISGTVRFETAPSYIAFTDGTFSGGTVSTANDLFFDTINWSSGTLSSDFTSNVSTGNLALTGSDPKTLSNVNFYNGIGANSTFEQGVLTMNAAAFINLAGASIDFQADASLVNGVPSDFVPFYNDGTLTKSTTDGVSEFYAVQLYNTGTVSVLDGTLRLRGGGTNDGTMLISSTGVLEFASPDEYRAFTTLDPGSVISGPPGSRLRFVDSDTDANGSIDVGGVELDNATVNLHGAMNSVTGAVGTALGRNAVVNVDGGSWTNSSYLQVGALGQGSINVTNAGTVSTFSADLGLFDPSATGYVGVSGANSNFSITDVLRVGTDGSGTISLSDSGQMTTGSLAFVGYGTGAFGTVSVDGAGSRWDASQQIVVGTWGTGTLIISNGGVVTSKKGTSPTSSAGIIGRLGPGAGTVIVSGAGSRWDMAGIGDDGTLNVGIGSVLVTDTGPGGTGFLDVNSGGVVTSVNGYIGRAAGGIGTAVIGGAGSAWSMTGKLFVGGDDSNPAPGGAGTLIVNAGGTVNAPVSTKVWNNGNIYYNGGTFTTGTLTLAGGGNVVLSPGNNKVLQTTSISVDAASKLDLADNKAIVKYSGPTPINGIRQQIQSAYNNGAWNGNGITSSVAGLTTGLGYGESTTLGITTFGGVALSGNNVLIKYTYFGDANMSGFVDVADLYAVASHFNTSGDNWTDGDFNYDGVVNVEDLKLLAKSWGAGMGAPLNAPALAPILTSLGLPDVEVPEPTGIGALVVASWSLARPRRRRIPH